MELFLSTSDIWLWKVLVIYIAYPMDNYVIYYAAVCINVQSKLLMKRAKVVETYLIHFIGMETINFPIS